MVIGSSLFAGCSDWIGARFRQFHHDQSGGAYTLSYVMTIPFMMLLIALTVESTLLLTAKIGTIYAAHSAARCASVYTTGHSWADTRRRAESAARQAMLPFASGSTRDDGAESLSVETEAILSAYEQWNTNDASSRYLSAKAMDAARRLNTEFPQQPAAWDSEIVVLVTYDYPFRLPGIGRLLGSRDSTGNFVFPIRSRAALSNDAPQNSRQHLGIGYGQP